MMNNILKQILNSASLSIFFGVLAYALFIKPKKKKVDLKNVDVSESTLSIAEADSIADICEQSFVNSWANGGTDEKTLERVLLSLSNGSFNHVYKAYGERKNMTLVQSLIDELDEDEIKPYVFKFTLMK